MRHMNIVVIAEGECCKTYGLVKERKKWKPNPSPFVCVLLPKLLGLGRTIYTWELYFVIINIQRNKE